MTPVIDSETIVYRTKTSHYSNGVDHDWLVPIKLTETISYWQFFVEKPACNFNYANLCDRASFVISTIASREDGVTIPDDGTHPLIGWIDCRGELRQCMDCNSSCSFGQYDEGNFRGNFLSYFQTKCLKRENQSGKVVSPASVPTSAPVAETLESPAVDSQEVDPMKKPATVPNETPMTAARASPTVSPDTAVEKTPKTAAPTKSPTERKKSNVPSSYPSHSPSTPGKGGNATEMPSSAASLETQEEPTMTTRDSPIGEPFSSSAGGSPCFFWFARMTSFLLFFAVICDAK